MWPTDLALINSERFNDLAILFLVSRTPYRHILSLQARSYGRDISPNTQTDRQRSILIYIEIKP